jgi:predicted nucleic acid-binding protein
MGLTVLYDACVLHPAPLRDLLMRIAARRLVRARWTERILDECFRSILKRRPDLEPRDLARTRALMVSAIPDCLVTGYEHLTEGLVLPDPDDRHVLAAAIHAGADLIVTFNLRDFPRRQLKKHDVDVQHPDDFVAALIAFAPKAIEDVVSEQLEALTNPQVTRAALLRMFEAMGLVQTVASLQAHSR